MQYYPAEILYLMLKDLNLNTLKEVRLINSNFKSIADEIIIYRYNQILSTIKDTSSILTNITMIIQL